MPHGYTDRAMIRVLMLDLGLTLIDDQRQPFAHVREALAALESFLTADGKPLRVCLVSDDTAEPHGLTPAQVRQQFDDYLTVLDACGLRGFFEPVQRRVTLASQAGVLKPAPAIFEKALARLRVKAGLDECLFITENRAHVAAARALGMQALQFRAPGDPGFDFDDWSQAPALVAQRLGVPANLPAAVSAHLAAQGVEVDTFEAGDGAGPWRVAGRRWHPVALPGHGTVHVALPVQGEVGRAPGGELTAQLPAVQADEAQEAGSFARSLAKQGQIASGDAALASATHAIEVDEQGRRRLVRRRFSAL